MKSRKRLKKFIARILLGVSSQILLYFSVYSFMIYPVPSQSITFNWKVFGLVFLIDVVVWSVMVLLFEEEEEDNDKGKF